MTSAPEPRDPRGPVHDYAGGEVSTHAGRVNRWLLVVYAILTVWAVYYLVAHWGGLGPGLGP
jgi:hypothetical protein